MHVWRRSGRMFAPGEQRRVYGAVGTGAFVCRNLVGVVLDLYGLRFGVIPLDHDSLAVSVALHDRGAVQEHFGAVQAGLPLVPGLALALALILPLVQRYIPYPMRGGHFHVTIVGVLALRVRI